ncbi:MAG: protein containing Planctomycete extracellular domain protein, partial [Pirellulaceae bacterium]
MQLFPRQSDSLSSLRRPPRTSRSSRFRRHRLRGIERLERRDLLAGLPYGATSKDTGEYMLGDVYVTVVFLESSTQTSPTNNNSETWTAAAISATKQKVQEGLQWWEDTLAGITTRHDLDFHLDFTYADNPVSTSFEPISRPSTDVQFWVYDFLNVVGFNRMGNFHDDIRAFNDAQRQSHDSDWAFTIFVVHDENDADHQFAPGGFSRAFAFAGGEFLVSPSSRPASTF